MWGKRCGSIKFSFVLWIFGLFFSCKPSESIDNSSKPFIINMDFEYIQNFLFLTNQDGQIVYKINKTESGLFDTVHVYGLNENDILDLTVGSSGLNGFFNIYTFRNIKSNFTWSIDADCSFSFLQGTRNDRKNIELTIAGINDYDELIFPHSGDDLRVEKKSDRIILSSSALYEDDYVITILPKNETQYKSYLLKNNVWSGDNGFFKNSIDFKDFEPSIIHKVIAPKAGDYTINAELIDSQNGVALLKFFDNIKLKKGDPIRFFLTSEMSIEKLRIRAWLTENVVNYFYQKISTHFPDSLEYYEPELSINFSENNFDIFMSDTKDFSEVNPT